MNTRIIPSCRARRRLERSLRRAWLCLLLSGCASTVTTDAERAREAASQDHALLDGPGVAPTAVEAPVDNATIVSTRLTGCPMMVAGAPNACEPGLVSALANLMQDLIEPRLLGMLSRLPVPVIWDAQGEADWPVVSSTIRRRQINQNVTYLVDIEDL